MTAREGNKLAGFVIAQDRGAFCASVLPVEKGPAGYCVDVHLIHYYRHVYIWQYSQRAALDAIQTLWSNYADALIRVQREEMEACAVK